MKIYLYISVYRLWFVLVVAKIPIIFFWVTNVYYWSRCCCFPLSNWVEAILIILDKCSLFGEILEDPTFLRLFNITLASFRVPVDDKCRWCKFFGLWTVLFDLCQLENWRKLSSYGHHQCVLEMPCPCNFWNSIKTTTSATSRQRIKKYCCMWRFISYNFLYFPNVYKGLKISF